MSSIDNFHQTQIYHIAPDATQTHTEKTGESSEQREKKNILATPCEGTFKKL